jgi:ferredoxin
VPKVRFLNEMVTVDVPENTTIREVAIQQGIEIYRGMWTHINCLGNGVCGRCKIWIVSDDASIAPKSIRERMSPFFLVSAGSLLLVSALLVLLGILLAIFGQLFLSPFFLGAIGLGIVALLVVGNIYWGWFPRLEGVQRLACQTRIIDDVQIRTRPLGPAAVKMSSPASTLDVPSYKEAAERRYIEAKAEEKRKAELAEKKAAEKKAAEKKAAEEKAAEEKAAEETKKEEATPKQAPEKKEPEESKVDAG